MSGPDPLAAPVAEASAADSGGGQWRSDAAQSGAGPEVLQSSIAWRSGLLERFARDGMLTYALPPQAGA